MSEIRYKGTCTACGKTYALDKTWAHRLSVKEWICRPCDVRWYEPEKKVTEKSLEQKRMLVG